jgi:site-specific recombinase XerC
MKKDKQGDTEMTALATRAGDGIKELAAILANFPAPDKWTNEMREQAVQFAALMDTAQKMITAANLAGVNYAAEKSVFLDNAGQTKSTHTRAAYRRGLDRLETWAARQGLNILEITPAQADDFIYSLRDSRAAASMRLDTAAASSFFTWLHRRHTAIENPFRGTKARPAKKAVKKIEVPTAAEIKTIIQELPRYEAAAAAIMAYRGLRAGALPSLSITGGKFTGNSKGKDIAGEMPAAAMKAIKAAALPLRGPFAGLIPDTLEKRVNRAITKLYKAEKIQAAYSCHALRHFYAITEYNKDRDIHRVSKLLGHASISVTENYLKGMGEIG